MRLAFVRATVWSLLAVAAVLFFIGIGTRLGEVHSEAVFIAFLAVGVVAGGINFLVMCYDCLSEESEFEECHKTLVGQSHNGTE